MTNAISKSRLAATASTTQDVDGLTVSLASKADAIAARVSSVEKEMEQICMDVATDCEDLEEGTVYAYLQRAFPEVPDKGSRRRFLCAGLMLHEGRRRRLHQLPSWTIAAEAYSLSPAGHEWFFSQENPPTRSAVREYKSKERAQHKATNSHTEKMSPTDDSSSPLITPVIDHHVTNVESSNTKLSFCEVVSDAQSEMGTSYHGRSKGVVPMDTTNNGAADEEYDEVLNLIDRIKTISSRHYRPNQPGTWTEHQWLNLTELYFTMHSIAEGYSRDYKQERRDYADQCIKQVATFLDAKDGSASNRIGGDA